MIDLKQFELWFVTGSQTLYGEETLKKVADHARTVAEALNAASEIPVRVAYRPPVTGPEAIQRLCREADAAPECVGLITWMHTFSPAKMWIAGLRDLTKPFVHLHTQFNRDLPWAAIDMDFMNLNQSAHGDREFGYLCSRMGLRRAVVVGHWQDPQVRQRLGEWSRAAVGRHELRRLRIARFGDNMREVAVTEGDKVEAQITLGCSVLGYGVGDLAAAVQQVSDAEIDRLLSEYDEQYAVVPELRPGGPRRGALREAARIELGLRAFLQDGGFQALTDTFEDLHGLRQLPGPAVQRLMADGYGFGAEGDWKTAALVRVMKVMAAGLPGGTSFMEDYTYHLAPGEEMVLGAHMLEVCPSIAAERPSLEIHPLSIGGKEDPVRLVFSARPGPAVNAALMDFGDRFRLLVNAVETIPPPAELPRLPVARAVWKPLPDFKTAAACWILAGGAHHTAYSHGVTTAMLEDLAEMLGLEFFAIGPETSPSAFRREVRAANERRRWH
ncbi:MAG: L-arabinose isomerase [Thermogutta sp.]|nr:L-arabinose isomerase [Thermogutta sp.]